MTHCDNDLPVLNVTEMLFYMGLVAFEYISSVCQGESKLLLEYVNGYTCRGIV